MPDQTIRLLLFESEVLTMGTAFVGGLLALLVGALIWKLVKDRKSGRSSCDGNCAHCKSCGK